MSFSIAEHFTYSKKSSNRKTQKHGLINITVLCVSAVIIVGADGWKDIVGFGNTKLDWLRQFVTIGVIIIRVRLD